VAVTLWDFSQKDDKTQTKQKWSSKVNQIMHLQKKKKDKNIYSLTNRKEKRQYFFKCRKINLQSPGRLPRGTRCIFNQEVIDSRGLIYFDKSIQRQKRKAKF
jgi:hypothetical protein